MPSTIAGSTMAEVMEAGSRVGSGLGGEREEVSGGYLGKTI